MPVTGSDGVTEAIITVISNTDPRCMKLKGVGREKEKEHRSERDGNADCG